MITAQDAVGLLDDLTAIVLRAADAVLRVRARALNTRMKADQSPVTAADEAAEAVILAGLAHVLPDTPVVSEESVNRPTQLGASFVLVDPIDGTRELVAGRDEFTVNVAVVSDGAPLLGIVMAPAIGQLWRGVVSAGAERAAFGPGAAFMADATARQQIRTRPWPSQEPVVALSRSHLDPDTEAFVARLHGARRVSVGSSLKFCRVAEGAADIYPRLGETSAWDDAAGHAVLAAAGGTVTDRAGRPLRYGAADRYRIPGFIAWGDLTAVARFTPIARYI